MRAKYRFIICQVDFSLQDVEDTSLFLGGLTVVDVLNAIRSSVVSNYGDLLWGNVAPTLSVRWYCPTTRLCVIRIPLMFAEKCHASVAMVHQIKSQRCRINTIFVSGSRRLVPSKVKLCYDTIVSSLQADKDGQNDKSFEISADFHELIRAQLAIVQEIC